MKMKTKRIFLSIIFLITLLSSCKPAITSEQSITSEVHSSTSEELIQSSEQEKVRLVAPTIEYIKGILSWEPVTNANSYALVINDDEVMTVETEYKLEDFGDYEAKVKAISSEESLFLDSDWSNTINVTYEPSFENYLFLDTSYVVVPMNDSYEIIVKDFEEKVVDAIFSGYNENIISVSEDGIVEPKAPGITKVTAAKRGYIDANLNIEVKAVLLSNLPASFELMVDDVMSLDVYGIPVITSDELLTFESSDPSIVYVGTTGIVSALREGTAIVSVSSTTNAELEFTINVVKAIPATLNVTVTIPDAIPEDYEVFLVGSFNNWTEMDENYKLNRTSDPLVFKGEFPDFKQRTRISYKFILKTTNSYCWEQYNGDNMANRTFLINAPNSIIVDTVTVWQPEVVA